MEDIISILITVGFVAVAVLANRKSKPQGRKAGEAGEWGEGGKGGETDAEGAEGRLPEGWPSMGIPQMKRHTAPKSTSRDVLSRALPQKMHPDSQEVIISETSAAADRKARKSVKEHSKTAPNAASAEPREDQSPLMSDFEIGKAVVWSEILKPKFTDE